MRSYLYQQSKADAALWNLIREVEAMAENFPFMRKSSLFMVDCLAVLVGALIAAPFVLILASPFISSF